MEEFVIDFNYQGTSYTGLVRPIAEDANAGYSVILESDNQELNLDIFAKPCGDDKMEWCFTDENRGDDFDKTLLQEVGEAIEKYQSNFN